MQNNQDKRKGKSRLSQWSSRVGQAFEVGKPLHGFKALFDAVDSFILTPATVTTKGTHLRDAVDMKRIMITVMIALLPALIFGMWNVGYQHFMSAGQSASVLKSLFYGFMKWLPMVIVTYAAGLSIEVLFAQKRGHEVAEGFFVTGFLIPMIMPPDIPLWIVAVATAFAVLFAKEVFGGTGYNFLNPALVARAFVFFAYPSVISGDEVWISKPLGDAISGATPLVSQVTPSTMDLLIGTIPGSFGETCKIAILIGAAILLVTQVASWKIMLSVFIGGFAFAALFHQCGMTEVNAIDQILMGGFCFGAVFMATDPVTAAHTNVGKYIFGFLVGALAIIIRVLNKGYPEGMMLSILLMNVFAPLIDYCVVQNNIRRRERRIKNQMR